MKEVFFAKSENGELTFLNKKEMADFLKKVGDRELAVEISNYKKQRTLDQNAALHKWFELLALELNLAGYTVQLVLKEKVDLDWDKDKVKELLWRPAQKAILKKKSTTELAKLEDIDTVWEHLNRHMSEKFGVHVPFPSKEQLQ